MSILYILGAKIVMIYVVSWGKKIPFCNSANDIFPKVAILTSKHSEAATHCCSLLTNTATICFCVLHQVCEGKHKYRSQLIQSL